MRKGDIKHGEYKSLLNTLEFDANYFLDSVLLTESYKSTQIEGNGRFIPMIPLKMI